MEVEEIIAAAAVAQVLAAVAIAAMTASYVKATNKIRTANEKLLEEMRADREHFHHQRSVDAAHRLTVALTTALRDWIGAEDDSGFARFGGLRSRPDRPEGLSAEEKRREAYRGWWLAHVTDRGAIGPTALRTDLQRMTDIFGAATQEWDAIVALAEGDDGDPSHPPPSRPDNRSHRLGWCVKRVLVSLEAHRRGEPVNDCVLPRDGGAFLSLPLNAGQPAMVALVESEPD